MLFCRRNALEQMLSRVKRYARYRRRFFDKFFFNDNSIWFIYVLVKSVNFFNFDLFFYSPPIPSLNKLEYPFGQKAIKLKRRLNERFDTQLNKPLYI